MMTALVIFSIIFFVVGVLRVVEFKAAGVPLKWRRILIPVHVIGCASLTTAMILFAIDPEQEQKVALACAFFVGIAILFPMHIYVNLKRKILSQKINK